MMFDKKSIYALNKLDKDAIVCESADGKLNRLTRADFESEAEFLKWKDWSDTDYMTTESDGRGFDDHCISLELVSESAIAVVSVEDAFIDSSSATAHQLTLTRLRTESKRRLTPTQYRRLWMFYKDGKSELEIALLEGVTQQSVSDSIAGARKKLKKFSKNYL